MDRTKFSDCWKQKLSELCIILVTFFLVTLASRHYEGTPTDFVTPKSSLLHRQCPEGLSSGVEATYQIRHRIILLFHVTTLESSKMHFKISGLQDYREINLADLKYTFDKLTGIQCQSTLAIWQFSCFEVQVPSRKWKWGGLNCSKLRLH